MIVTTAPAALADPAGRLPYTWNADTQLLHTIQRREVLDELQAHGRSIPTLEHSDHADDWPQAYAWIAQQVAARAGVDHGTGAVFWAWARTTRADLARTTRAAARHAAQHGGTEVLLTLNAPRERVVMSCFSDWHAVLNAWPLPDSEQRRQAQAAWDADADWSHPVEIAYQQRTGKTWFSWEEATDAERAACQDTWQQCLRTGTPPMRRDSIGNRVHWQACLPDLRIEDVTHAVILTA